MPTRLVLREEAVADKLADIWLLLVLMLTRLVLRDEVVVDKLVDIWLLLVLMLARLVLRDEVVVDKLAEIWLLLVLIPPTLFAMSTSLASMLERLPATPKLAVLMLLELVLIYYALRATLMSVLMSPLLSEVI